MPSRDRIVVGASAGGVEALTNFVQQLPNNLPAAIFVVVHFPIHSTSFLPQILRRAGQLPAEHAVEGEIVRNGRIYVAPPGWHMLIKEDQVHLVAGPREHGFRPAIDPLFRSAAQTYGPRTIGVILSGTLSDGVVGLQAIRRAGGMTLVQDPEEALFPGMPLNAIEQVQVDYVLPATRIAQMLKDLVLQSVPFKGVGKMVDDNRLEADFVEQDVQTYIDGHNPNDRTVLTCPECGGVIWELREGDLLRFRCHVGHAYSADSLLAEQSESLEGALWTAVHALEERASLLGRLATQAARRKSNLTAERFQQQAQDTERQADVVRQVLLNGKLMGLENSDDIQAMEETEEPPSIIPPDG